MKHFLTERRILALEDGLERSSGSAKGPKVVDSGLSQAVYIDGFVFDVFIYRPNGDATWTLEVVDEVCCAHIWMTDFASDLDALTAAKTAIREVGPVAFMSDGNGPPPS